ncbi:class B sortase [Staphylococcus capitis]|uniref:class B sortase n=1 Tax=Staphylococcus capitis TaxID=29388 RepID=UPI000D19CAAE|nr:class B sortase [Staphylococcus capitis]PTG27399.1 SrtB family sortase [Staphylococcus capitis]PTG31326.1 SrtB family sortase [Staphylococcus capitis]PTH00903.1 SrtB family sortase [Staphylococcus capitis]PTH04633.1 SrtB family sortase [Staphylococcus capitis]PTH07462.1 SrtB family sortase [Staphylococcus capitis]
MIKFVRLIQIVLIAVILIFSYQLFKTYLEDKASAKRYKNLQQQFKSESLSNENEVRPQFSKLESINKDIVGWIQLKGTSLNYPVLQGKTNHDYLREDFDHEKTRKGSIFMDYRNSVKTPNSNTIIYGHHMGDNTMFDVLEKYLKQSYFDQHQDIQYDTKYGKYLLQVFSAYRTTTKDNYIQTDFKTPSEFQHFIDNTKKKSEIQTKVQITNQDKIVTLSTCEDAYNQTSGRIVVVAKLVKIN